MMETVSLANDQRLRPLSWTDFCAELPTLQIACLEGDQRHFTSWIDDRRFGEVHMRRVGSDGVVLRGERSPALIHSQREELIWIPLVLSGHLRIRQGDCSTLLSVGDLAMIDALQPYSLETSAHADTLWLGAPRSVLCRHVWDLDELLGLGIRGDHGPGLMASRVLTATFGSMPHLADSDGFRVAGGMLDILGAAIDAQRTRFPGSRHSSALLRRIKARIEASLADENLTVARIAREHGISTRHLARLFAMESATVSGWIWQRRLERCHAALSSAGRPTNVSRIAYANGFKNLSHFSRTFRDRYGVSPRDLLRPALEH